MVLLDQHSVLKLNDLIYFSHFLALSCKEPLHPHSQACTDPSFTSYVHQNTATTLIIANELMRSTEVDKSTHMGNVSKRGQAEGG